MGEFGDKFRTAREKKNLTLDDVSKVTKISPRMLQAIEEQKFDLLPGGVFNKGFIRAYAKHLGINDEEAVTEYLACLRQAQIEAQAVWEPPSRLDELPKATTPDRKNGKPNAPTHTDELDDLHMPRPEHVRPPHQKYVRDRDNGIPWRLVAVALVVIVLTIVLWRRNSRSNAEDAATPPASPPAQTTQPAPTSAPPAAQNSASTDNHPVAPAGAGTPASQATKQAAGSGSTETLPAHSPTSSSSTPATPPTGSEHAGATAPAKNSSDAEDNDVTVRPVPATKPKALTLVIRAAENSWISVTADGQTVSRETLIAPANTSVRANHEIVTKVGNAAGVSFVWNGQEIPAQGAESEVKTFIFDAQGMHVVTPPASPVQN